MALIKFGQYVRIEVVSEDSSPVFSSDSLRLDFDIRNISEFVRAKIDIYNLNEETAGKIMNGKNYVTVYTSLHGGEEVILANSLFISNALNEFVLPNNITSLYCFSPLKNSFLEKQLEGVEVKTPSLRNCIDEISKAGEFKGEFVYKHFPEGWVDRVPDKPLAKLEGSVQSCLRMLSREYKFQFYVEDGNIKLMYQVQPENVATTTLASGEADVKLSTDNMRSNPKLGPSTIEIESNLDPMIKPSAVVDISDLLTAGTGVSEDNLNAAVGLIKNTVSGFNRYQIYQIAHRGSNFTGTWVTTASGVAPTSGITMPNSKYNWFK